MRSTIIRIIGCPINTLMIRHGNRKPDFPATTPNDYSFDEPNCSGRILRLRDLKIERYGIQ